MFKYKPVQKLYACTKNAGSFFKAETNVSDATRAKSHGTVSAEGHPCA